MDVTKRILLIRIIEKIERNQAFSTKLGTQDKSVLKTQKNKNRENTNETYYN